MWKSGRRGRGDETIPGSSLALGAAAARELYDQRASLALSQALDPRITLQELKRLGPNPR